MTHTIKRSLVVILLAGIVSGAFLMGQRLGAHAGQPPRPAPRLLAADAGVGSLGEHEAASGQAETSVAPSEVFTQVLDYVQKQYVRGYGGARRLSNGALSSMIASLDDPGTNYLDPTMRQARQSALEGHYQGIGAMLTLTETKSEDVDYRYLTVMDVMPTSPAEKAGLKTGDHITGIDGHWIIAYSVGNEAERLRQQSDNGDAAQPPEVRANEKKTRQGYSLTKAMAILSQGEKQTHLLAVMRHGQNAPMTLSVTTALTEVNPVEYRIIGDNVGYLRIRQFNAMATASFEKALQGASSLKGLVVDLRQNPGGVTTETLAELDGFVSARDLIASLTGGGVVATVEPRPNQREPLRVKPSDGRLHVPLAVLVDGGTANLSEMVAAALHDAGKAKLVGTRTFGDDVLELFATMKSGAGIEIASAHLLTASGVDLRQGMRPDIDLGVDGADKDTAVRYAVNAVGG